MHQKKATKQRGLVGRVKSALMRPQTYWIAVWILRLISLVARIIDRLH